MNCLFVRQSNSSSRVNWQNCRGKRGRQNFAQTEKMTNGTKLEIFFIFGSLKLLRPARHRRRSRRRNSGRSSSSTVRSRPTQSLSWCAPPPFGNFEKNRNKQKCWNELDCVKWYQIEQRLLKQSQSSLQQCIIFLQPKKFSKLMRIS